MEKKLAEYKCNTNEAINLKLGNVSFLNIMSLMLEYFSAFLGNIPVYKSTQVLVCTY